jgi:hypothetical protein
MRTQIHVLAIAAILAAGCGSTVSTGGTSSSNGGGGGNTSTTTGGGSGLCPPADPTGQSCAGFPSPFQYTYGDSVRPECRQTVVCVDATWEAMGGTCVKPPPDMCGGTQPADGTVCTGEGNVCTFDNTICICSSCSGGPCMAPPPKWQCAPPPSTPGCPPVVPNDGTACSMNGLSCTYGIICSPSGVQVDCKNGAWLWNQNVACPL